MSALSTITNINAKVIENATAAVLVAQALRGNASGAETQSKVVRVLTGIEVGTGALETHSNHLVAQAATLVNMIVQLAKLFGAKGFAAPVAGGK